MTNTKMKFTTLRENFQAAALAGAVYVPYAAKYSAVFGFNDLLQQLAIIGGMFMALRLPLVREIPLLLTRAVLVPLLMRGRQKDPELQAMVDDMLKQTGSGKKVTVRTYERGITNNAVALGHDILVGRTLRDTLSAEEMKFVLAHELSHIESEDISERYAFWPPYIDSVFMMFGAVGAGFSFMMQGAPTMQGLAVTGTVLGLSAAYYGMASGIRRYHSRLGEYRADANALRLTRNLPAAVGALETLYSNMGEDIDRQPTRWQTFAATHPIGRDRIGALEELSRTLPGADRAGTPVPA